MQFTSSCKRLAMLYAVHEVFRGCAKDPGMKMDYGAWKDALRALVPWAWRKQKEEDQSKIRKAVSFLDVGSYLVRPARYPPPLCGDSLSWEA